jgi:tetratricopeptide repeat protein 30
VQILKLQAAIKYGADELADAKSLVDKCPKDDHDTEINRGCLLYKEGRYDEALQKFNSASQVIGYDPHVSYNMALTQYRLQNIPMAAKHIGKNTFIYNLVFDSCIEEVAILCV